MKQRSNLFLVAVFGDSVRDFFSRSSDENNRQDKSGFTVYENGGFRVSVGGAGMSGGSGVGASVGITYAWDR